jgi:5-formyltetrahydrofolate cyclo-ligase
MDKKTLRNQMKSVRQSIPADEKEDFDKSIFNKVISSTIYKEAKILFIYVSFGSEVDTHRIIEQTIKDNKSVYVPKVINRIEGMAAVKISSLSELKASSLGILEPEDIHETAKPWEFDLILIPGLAFDSRGGRLGYGAGYYDSFLKEIRPETQKVGLAYSCQVIEEVPMEKQDVFIDHIITE